MPNKIVLYTDGACKGNPGPGGWAWVQMEADKELVYDAGGEEETTNNRMELTAVIEALRSFDDALPLWIYTDSSYVVKGVKSWLANWKANNWRNAQKKPVANKQLWCTLDELLQARNVKMHWVKGHHESVGNIKADKYASDQAYFIEHRLATNQK